MTCTVMASWHRVLCVALKINSKQRTELKTGNSGSIFFPTTTKYVHQLKNTLKPIFISFLYRLIATCQQSCGKVMFSQVSLSFGPHVTITHDALGPTVQGSFAPSRHGTCDPPSSIPPSRHGTPS